MPVGLSSLLSANNIEDDLLSQYQAGIRRALTMDRFLRHVFDMPVSADSDPLGNTVDSQLRLLSLENVEKAFQQRLMSLRDTKLDITEADNTAADRHPLEFMPGRLGPRTVQINISSSNGALVQSPWSPLEVESVGSFGSVRANVCVFRGKWFYEATVMTPGVQQIGWATLECPFTQEQGVGDAPNSFAFDGKRSCKWNVSASAYGQTWVSGDVITCAIDLDEDKITFYRNGRSLGVAYERFRDGNVFAYFPAISLSQGERTQLNFGGSAFKFPLSSYQPLEMASSVAIPRYLMGCLDRVLPFHFDHSLENKSAVALPPSFSEGAQLDLVSDGSVVIATSLIMAKLAFLFGYKQTLEPIHVETVLLPALQKYHNEGVLPTVIDLFFSHFEKHEKTDFVGALMHSLADLTKCLPFTNISALSGGTYPATTLCFETSAHVLDFVVALLQNESFRRYWILQPRALFYGSLEAFFFTKSPNNEDLQMLFPKVNWSNSHPNSSECSTKDEVMPYLDALNTQIRLVETLHYKLCTIMLSTAFPGDQRPGMVFLIWLRSLLYRNRLVMRSVADGDISSTSVLVNLFLALNRIVVEALAVHGGGSSRFDSQQMDAVTQYLASLISPALFGATPLTDDLDLIEIQGSGCTLPFYGLGRLGGTLSHLKRTFIPPNAPSSPRDNPSKPLISIDTLVILFDSVLVLYHYTLVPSFKAANQSMQNRESAVNQLYEIEERYKQAGPGDDQRILHQQARNIILTSVFEAARSCYWNKLRMLDPENLHRLYYTATTLAGLMLHIKTQSYFVFVPEYYLESMLDAFHALSRADPAIPIKDNFTIGVDKLITCLCTMCFDKRIVNPDIRDILLHSITIMFQNVEMLAAIESNTVARSGLMEMLISNFEERSWLPIVKILLRMNKASSWGRIREISQVPRESLLSIPLGGDDSVDTTSSLFQHQFRLAMTNNVEQCKKFINRLFNHMNWSFTELGVCMNAVADRSLAVPIHQIIAKYSLLFDVTISLLKCLEFICQVVPERFMDEADVMLMRMTQLLFLLLTRTTVGNNSKVFNTIITKFNVPSQRYALLAPLFGIIMALIDGANTDRSSNLVIKTLASESTLGDNVFEFLLGPEFDFSQYGNCTQEQIAAVRFALQRVIEARASGSEMEQSTLSAASDAENLCPICYTEGVSTKFVPCGHLSCFHCISRHLLDSSLCFFCKAKLLALETLATGVVVPVQPR